MPKKKQETKELPAESRREDLRVHVFSVSAAMVGVCLTVIGIIRMVIAASRVGSLADDILSVDALLFLVSCFLAYGALRSSTAKMTQRLENAADYVFIPAMAMMFLGCVAITYSLL